jgi:hypothetical protein
VVGDGGEDVCQWAGQGFGYEGQGVLGWTAGAEAGGQEIDREGEVAG